MFDLSGYGFEPDYIHDTREVQEQKRKSYIRNEYKKLFKLIGGGLLVLCLLFACGGDSKAPEEIPETWEEGQQFVFAGHVYEFRTIEKPMYVRDTMGTKIRLWVLQEGENKYNSNCAR